MQASKDSAHSSEAQKPIVESTGASFGETSQPLTSSDRGDGGNQATAQLVKTGTDKPPHMLLFSLREQYGGRVIFGGLDRLESLAGIMLKIRAFKEFLTEFPRYRNKVVLVQCAYPSTAHGEVIFCSIRWRFLAHHFRATSYRSFDG